MTDQQLALQAVSDAQRILEVLERPDLLVAINRMQRVS
jgi:hypothetical protein